MSNEIYDLRSAIEFLKKQQNQLVETSIEADPNAEIAGVYRYVGAGGTVPRPTKKDGPAMLFNNVKGFPNKSVLIGLLASRKRVGMLLNADYKKLGWHLRNAVNHPISPVVINTKPVCQEEIYLASDKDFDLRKLVPAPTIHQKMLVLISQWESALELILKMGTLMLRFIVSAFNLGMK